MQQIRSGNELTPCLLLDTFDFSPWVYDPFAKAVGNFVRVNSNQIKAVNIVSNTTSENDQNKKINL